MAVSSRFTHFVPGIQPPFTPFKTIVNKKCLAFTIPNGDEWSFTVSSPLPNLIYWHKKKDEFNENFSQRITVQVRVGSDSLFTYKNSVYKEIHLKHTVLYWHEKNEVRSDAFIIEWGRKAPEYITHLFALIIGSMSSYFILEYETKDPEALFEQPNRYRVMLKNAQVIDGHLKQS